MVLGMALYATNSLKTLDQKNWHKVCIKFVELDVKTNVGRSIQVGSLTYPPLPVTDSEQQVRHWFERTH